MEADDQKNPASPPSALESAIQAIERSLRPDGPGHGDIPDGERGGYEWRTLFHWAEREGRSLPASLKPERLGGREHDLTFLPQDRRWRKFTKPDGAGLIVDFAEGVPLLLPATPLQYFKRLKLQNEFWSDDIRIEGIQIQTPGAKIVTTQPDVKGEAPSLDLLHHYLCGEFGFRLLNIAPMGYYKSHSYLMDCFAMFDVHPANCVQVTPKILLPIDVIMMEFEGEELEALQAAL
jgi:hypothetical protein